MTSHDTADIDKHVRTYVLVFVALMALTIVTVAISYLDLSVAAAVGVALLVAAVKGSLVVGSKSGQLRTGVITRKGPSSPDWDQ